MAKLFGVGGVRWEGAVNVCEPGEEGFGRGGVGRGRGSGPLETVVDVVGDDDGVVLAG